MPITQEENDKIQENLEKQIEEQTPEETQETEETPKGESGTGNTEEVKPYWAQEGFKSETEFIESYKSAQSMIGRQATEIGDLRKATQEPPKEEKPEEPFDEYDPYDEENAKYFQQKWARDAVEDKNIEDSKAQAEVDAKESELKMIGKFVENHSEGTDNPLNGDQLKEVAQFARDNGIQHLEHAYTVMYTGKETHSRSQDTGQNRGKQISELPNTLSDTGGGGKKEKKYADMSQSEWSNTSREEREQALRDA